MKGLPVLDSQAAAIDAGSESLHVSIAGGPPKVFGTFTGDLESLCGWFGQQGARSVSVGKALGGFYRRLRGRIGGLAANVALARKLALLFYRLLRYGLDYVEKGLKTYETKVLQTEARLLRKLAKKQGFALVPSAAI